MTAEELLAAMAEPLAEDDRYCIIDPETRVITIPPEYQLLGVESDEKAERIYFKCPKIVGDDIDLSKLALRVNFRNAGAVVDQYLVDDVAVDGDNITFSWLLSRRVTQYEGDVNFIVCAVRVSGETITNEWNTTLATAQVLEGLEAEVLLPEDETDIVNQLLALAETRLNDVRDATSAANTAASNANQKAQEAENAAEDARAVTEQITKDSYLHTALQSFIDTVTASPTAYGNAIVKKIEGFIRQETTTGAQLFDAFHVDVANGARNAKALNGGKDVQVTGKKSDSGAGYAYYTIPASLVDGKSIYVYGEYSGNASFSMSIKKSDNTWLNQGIQTRTWTKIDIPQGALQARVILYPNGVTATDETAIFKNIKVGFAQFETWEPYTGGQPAPNPDYPMVVQGTGKKKDAGYAICVKSRSRNMIPFPYDYVSTTTSNGVKFVSDSTGRYYLNGNASASPSVVHLVQNYTSPDDFEVLAELENGKEYYAKDVQVFVIHADGTNNTINAMQTARTYVGISGDRIAGFRVLVLASGSYTPDRIYEPMFCEKGEDNSFVPPSQYNVTYIPVDYPLFEGDKIIQRNGEYKLLRKWKQEVFDGSEDEGWVQSKSNTNQFYTSQYKEKKVDADIVSNRFKHATSVEPPSIWIGNDINIYFESGYLDNNTIAGFQEWLQENPVSCVYELATPTEELLSPEAKKALHSIMATDEQTELTIVGIPADAGIQNQFLLPRNEDGALNTTAYCTAEKNKIVLNELVAQNLDARVNKLEIDNASLAEQTIIVE